jgi:hypothetical protein
MSTVASVAFAALGGGAAGLVADHLARAYVEGRALLTRGPQLDAASHRWRRACILALAAAGMAAALVGQRGGMLAGTLALCALLAAIGRIDWACRLVFPQLLATGHAVALGLALLGSRAVPPWRGQVGWALACAAAYGALWALATLIHRLRAGGARGPIGIGDVALAALVGALLGGRAPGALLAGQLLAGVAGAVVIARRRGRYRCPAPLPAGQPVDGIAAPATETVPLGSYLSLAALVALCLR